MSGQEQMPGRERPLTRKVVLRRGAALAVTGVGSLAVHAEEFRPGGEVLHGDSPDVAVRNAEVFARLMAELAGVTVAPPLPNPPWVRWDHTDPGVWPAMDCLDNRDQSVVPAYVVDTAERTRRRMLAAGLRRDALRAQAAERLRRANA